MTTGHIRTLYDRVVLGKPWVVILLLAAALACSAWYAKDFTLDASADALLLENDKSLREFREVVERYQTKEFLFVTFTPKGDLFSDPVLDVIKELRGELRGLPQTDSVLSLLDVPLVRVVEGTLTQVGSNVRTLEQEGVDRARARRELLESPIFNQLIISSDAKTTALLIYLKDEPRLSAVRTERDALRLARSEGGLDAEQAQRLQVLEREYLSVRREADDTSRVNIETIRAILDKYRQHGVFHLGGVPMITHDMITFIKKDLVVFGCGVFLFLVAMLATIFRRIRWVLLPLISCAYAGMFMIGLLGMVGWYVTVVSSNFVSLMLILTMSMNVHLVVRYRELKRDNPGSTHRSVVLDTTCRMFWPCLYTALTTMVGFASLVFSGIKPVIDFGWMMTIGLSVAFASTFLLYPSLLMLLEKSDPADVPKQTVPFTAALASITLRHGNLVLGVAGALAVLSAWGISQLRVENSFINYFKSDTEIYQGLKLIDEKLGGTTPLDVVLKFKPEPVEDELAGFDDDEFNDEPDFFAEMENDTGDSQGGWFTSFKVDRIKAVHDYFDGLEAVGKVLSLASVLRVAEGLNNGKEFGPFELAIIHKRLPTALKESAVDPYLSVADDEARISLRVVDSLPDLRRNELLKKIHADLKDKLGLDEDDVQVTGLLVLYNNMLQSLFKSQILTLGAVLLGIGLMLLVLFRSLMLALLGIIPNILSAAVILGLMGLLKIPLDMMTITIAAITIGIAVDNCIHYIYRFREELPRHGTYEETLRYCHANIGRAAFYTSVTIVVGFSILVLSNFIPTVYFGLLTGLAMVMALFGALTLLPKMLLVFRPIKLPAP